MAVESSKKDIGGRRYGPEKIMFRAAGKLQKLSEEFMSFKNSSMADLAQQIQPKYVPEVQEEFQN